MSLRYRILYRLGITPWDRDEVPAAVRQAAEQWPQPGRALDLGCGTGRDAVFLAQRGWEVAAIDATPQALDAARRRAQAAGVKVNWVQGDVARLQELGIGDEYDFVLDRGCFHGLGDQARANCAAGVTALTGPGARLLMFAFAPGFHGPAPRGVSAEQLTGYFGDGWELVSSERETEARLPRWIGDARPTWHSLARRA